MQGYQLDLVPYTDWYQKVKEVAGMNSEHSMTLASLLYLLDAITYVAYSRSSMYITFSHFLTSSWPLSAFLT
jgi:hypothetical protein